MVFFVTFYDAVNITAVLFCFQYHFSFSFTLTFSFWFYFRLI